MTVLLEVSSATSELITSLLALAVVTALAWGILTLAARGGLTRSSGRMRVLERLPIDAKSSVVLVTLGDDVLVLGVGEGPPRLLKELRRDALPAAPARRDFASLLRSAREASAHPPSEPPAPRDP